MPKVDALEIFTFIISMAIAIGFILFMMIIFFSLKVEIKDERMERFLLETANSITSTNLTDHRSVFNPDKLTEAERTNSRRDAELYAQSCEYGYHLDVESLAGSTQCSRDSECGGFCGSVCGLTDISLGITGNCNCNIEILGDNFCECKKSGQWQDKYRWGYGYVAPGKTLIREVSSEFPAGISAGATVLPARMKITAYSSFITRATCIAAKAYETKEKASVRFDTSHVARRSILKRTDPSGTHICIYFNDESYDCRYMPDIPVLESRVDLPLGKDSGVITAYPLRFAFDTCESVKNNPSVIAGRDDVVAAVLLCTEAT